MWGLAFLIGLFVFFLTLVKCALYQDVGKNDGRMALSGATLIIISLVGYVFDAYSSTL